MTSPPPRPRVVFELHGEPGLAGGVYANALAVWHTEHEFTLDFMVNTQPPQPASTPEGETVIRVPRQLVTRVRIPPGVVFEVIRAINENMTNYEQVFGQIRRPGQEPPMYPPHDQAGGGEPAQ